MAARLTVAFFFGFFDFGFDGFTRSGAEDVRSHDFFAAVFEARAAVDADELFDFDGGVGACRRCYGDEQADKQARSEKRTLDLIPNLPN